MERAFRARDGGPTLPTGRYTMRRLLAAVGVLAVGAGGAAADAPPGPRLDGLVRQLGDARYRDREAAARELLRAGPDAVPALRAALTGSPDPEVRARAEGLLDQLARQADSARLITPKLVTYDYRAVPLAAVINDLKTKTGINLTLVPGKVADPARPVTLTAAGEVPAWQAVEDLCAAAGLREEFRIELAPPNQQSTSYYPNARFRRVYDESAQQHTLPGAVPVFLADGKGDAVPGSRASAVRVLALPGRFPANKIVRGAGRVILTLDVTPLPGLNWQEVSSVRVTRADDEDGRPVFADLKPQNDLPANPGYGWGWGGQMWAGGGIWIDNEYGYAGPRGVANPRLVPVALRTDDRAIRKLARFEGVVVGEVNLTNVPLFTVDALAEAAGKPPLVGPNDTKLSVTGYAAGPDGRTTVRVRVEMWQQWVLQQLKRGGFNNGVMFWGGGWNDSLGNLPNQLAWADAAGKPVGAPQQTSSSYTGDGWRQSVEVEFQFPKTGKHGPPVKLVMRGTKPVTVEVPFRMTDVALP